MIYTNDSFTQLICELENNCPPTWQLYTNGRIEKRCIETYIKTNVVLHGGYLLYNMHMVRNSLFFTVHTMYDFQNSTDTLKF